MKNKKPLVSIVIPTRNCENTIRDLLESIKRQRYKNFEVIIVDDSSDDKTAEIAKGYSKTLPIRIFQTNKREGANAARNLGIINAKGDIIALTDCDCKLPENWVENIVKEMINNDADIVAGSAYASNINSFFSEYLDKSFLSPLQKYKKDIILKGDFNPLVIIATNNLAVREYIFKKIGLFDKAYKWYGSDDMDFAYRALIHDFKIKCSPYIIVFHKNRTNILKILKRYFQYGIGFSIFLRKNKESRFSKLIFSGFLGLFSWYLLSIIALLYNAFIGIMLLLLPYISILMGYAFLKERNLKVIVYAALDLLLAFSSFFGLVISPFLYIT